MTSYRVRVYFSGSYVVETEADTPQQAEDLAYDNQTSEGWTNTENIDEVTTVVLPSDQQ